MTIVGDLRAAWKDGRVVWLSLSDRCSAPSVSGQVKYVSPTSAWILVDDLHIPTADITAVVVLPDASTKRRRRANVVDPDQGKP